MNPELCPAPLPRHLTEAEFGEIISAPAAASDRALTTSEQHLQECGQCAAELAMLRESLALFREASAALAESELRHIPPVILPRRRVIPFPLRPVYLAVAAALLLAALLPMQMLRQRSRPAAPQAAATHAATDVQTYAIESNEALLDDVDRAASASVPDSMQALADPMGGTDLSVQKQNQRKD